MLNSGNVVFGEIVLFGAAATLFIWRLGRRVEREEAARKLAEPDLTTRLERAEKEIQEVKKQLAASGK